jgi:hypothetical protein
LGYSWEGVLRFTCIYISVKESGCKIRLTQARRGFPRARIARSAASLSRGLVAFRRSGQSTPLRCSGRFLPWCKIPQGSS